MKKRIISATIMILILIPFIIIGGVPFRMLAGIVGILGYKELIELKGFKNYPISVIIIGLIVLLMLIFSNRDMLYSIIGLNYKYIVGSYLLMLVPSVILYRTKKYTTQDAFYLSSFIIYLGLFLNIISNILIYNKAYFFMILLATTMTDTFAYFTGISIGKHKFSKISPNKTIEGCVGGIIMGTIITSIYYMTFIGAANVFEVITATLLLSIACEIGDLFFSAIKREKGIKDFSNLIPGHGGVLDRLDSLSFVTYTLVLLIGFI